MGISGSGGASREYIERGSFPRAADSTKSTGLTQQPGGYTPSDPQSSCQATKLYSKLFFQVILPSCTYTTARGLYSHPQSNLSLLVTKMFEKDMGFLATACWGPLEPPVMKHPAFSVFSVIKYSNLTSVQWSDNPIWIDTKMNTRSSNQCGVMGMEPQYLNLTLYYTRYRSFWIFGCISKDAVPIPREGHWW